MKSHVSLLYVSTNGMWSGSEELWYASAMCFQNENFKIHYSCRYQNEKLENIKGRYFDLNHIYTVSFLNRIKSKLLNKSILYFNFKSFLKTIKPDFVIFSRGNNVEGLNLILVCKELNLKYVIINQLVTEYHISDFNEVFVKNSILASEHAQQNYFVSMNNLDLNNRMLCYQFKNNSLVFNPFVHQKNNLVSYPKNSATKKIALIGRIDFLHKGIDLFLEVVKQNKWKERDIEFNIYGDGPHKFLLIKLIQKYELKNVHCRGKYSSLEEVWQQNEILLMPSRMEGQALALIEALHFKRSAIVTNVGGASELIDDMQTGFIAASATVKEIDEALERAWKHKDEWEIFGEKAYEKIKSIYPPDAIEFFNQKIIDLLAK